MIDVKNRIKQARKDAKLTQLELAKAIGMTRGMVGMWESLGRPELPKVSEVILIAKACNTTTGWLCAGEARNVSEPIVSSALVPLVYWHTIEKKDFLLDFPLDKDSNEWVLCPIPHGKRTYCLKVEGPSMASNGDGSSYPQESIIYCDPDQSENAITGSPVIAYLKDAGEHVFKIYYKDGGKKWLTSLNPAFQNIDEDFEIRALVIGVFSPT